MPVFLREWTRHTLSGSLSALRRALDLDGHLGAARRARRAEVQLAKLLLTQVFLSPGP